MYITNALQKINELRIFIVFVVFIGAIFCIFALRSRA
jgi:hypothetical protein